MAATLIISIQRLIFWNKLLLTLKNWNVCLVKQPMRKLTLKERSVKIIVTRWPKKEKREKSWTFACGNLVFGYCWLLLLKYYKEVVINWLMANLQVEIRRITERGRKVIQGWKNWLYQPLRVWDSNNNKTKCKGECPIKPPCWQKWSHSGFSPSSLKASRWLLLSWERQVQIRKKRYKADLNTVLQNDLGRGYWHMAPSKWMRIYIFSVLNLPRF